MQILSDKDISIACITETWFDSKNGTFTKRIKNAGFEIHHGYRENKRGGGSAIIYKRGLTVKHGAASTSEYLSFEFSYVTLTLQSKRKMLLANVYRNQEIPIGTFQNEFTAFMDTIMNKGDVMLIVGDFNVWTDVDNAEWRKLQTLMNAYGLNQMVKQPTHRSGHTLDHMYINEQVNFEHQVVNDTFGLLTDHYPIFIEIPSTKNSEAARQTIEFRQMKNVDMLKFREDIQETCNALSDDLDFVSHIEQFRKLSHAVVDQHAPLVTRKVRTRESAWVDVEYKKNRALRRKLERKWKKERTDENRMRYIEQKAICTQMALQKQKAYYSKLVNDCKNSQKSLFKVANELLDKNEDRVLPSHSDHKQLANEFNHYYIDKVNKIRESIPDVDGDCTYYARPFQGERLSMFRPTTDEEVKEVIKECGIKTSVEDPIPAQLLKPSLDIILPVFTSLVNKSLSEGSMDGVKSSVIDPLIKKAGLDVDTKKNYRPVNNLVFFSKLTERIVTRRLEEHMTRNCLNEHTQFAYKKHHNTEMMMVGIFDEVLKGFDENKATIIVFLDLSAAFDTIDIDKLIEILHEELGIDGVALQWFRSFLSGRTQRVKIANQYSESCEVPCGAPQGSVLGPRLFNINVRSQPQVFKKCTFNTSSFADDSNGRRTFALTFQFQVIKNDVVNCMDKIVSWSHAHFMKINPEKTELLLLYPSSLSKAVKIRGVLFEDQCIRFSRQVKNVGVWIDCNLTLDKHVNSVVHTAIKF